MNNAKRIAIIVVLAGVFCGTFALAQTAKTKTDDFKAKAEAATAEMLSRLIRYYSATDDQKVKLKEALVAQYKDLADYDKVRAPKIKALDDEIAVVTNKIAELQKEIAAIEKRKGVHEKARAELLLDHKAEISNVFTPEQRIARVSNHIRSYAIYHQYWVVLPKADQASIKSQCDDAAMKLIQDGKSDDTTAVSAAYRKIRKDANKILTPELRQTGEAQYLYNSAIRKFARIKLTDAQKDSVRDLCTKFAQKKVRISAQYAQVYKDQAALRRTLSGMSSSSSYYKIREDVVETILTDEQLAKGGFKRKSSTAPKKL